MHSSTVLVPFSNLDPACWAVGKQRITLQNRNLWTFTETRFLPYYFWSGVECCLSRRIRAFFDEILAWVHGVHGLSFCHFPCRPSRPQTRTVRTVRTVRTESLCYCFCSQTVANCIWNLRFIHRSRQFELLSYSITTVWTITTLSLMRLKENERR